MEMGWIVLAAIAAYYLLSKKKDTTPVTTVGAGGGTSSPNETVRVQVTSGEEGSTVVVRDIPTEDVDRDVADDMITPASDIERKISSLPPTTTYEPYRPSNPDVVLTPYERNEETVRRVITTSPSNAYRATAEPVAVNPEVTKGMRDFFLTHQPGEWYKREEDRKAYALLYGEEWLQPLDNQGKVIENMDPVWVVPHKVVRYTDRRPDYYIYNGQGEEVIFNYQTYEVYYPQ